MRVYPVRPATSEIEKLSTKHRDIWDAIAQFERLLSHSQTHGHTRYPNLHLTRGDQPASVWKSRVIYPPLGGKSSGLRYVYERISVGDEECAVGLMIYIHQQGLKESDSMTRIRDRVSLFQTTPEGLRKLDGSDTQERRK